MTSEEWTLRRLKANETLLKMIEAIDPADDDACRKFEAVSKLYHELNADIKNNLDKETREQELDVEREKIKTEAKTKAEAIEAERDRTKSEAHRDKLKVGADLIGKGIIGASTVYAAWQQYRMYNRATEKEKDESILTLSDQTVVRNGLSWKFWK